MADRSSNPVLTEAVLPSGGLALRAKQVALVAAGIAALALAAKVKVPLWPSPVPITMGSFAVLLIAAAYGPRLGLVTVLGYLFVGLLGWDVFASSAAGASGLEYMLGGTGGYLLGYLLATVAIGWAARRGWDRSVAGTGAAMLIGTALIYLPGILWLGVLYGWDQPILAWGLYPFLIGDALKLGLAALLVPALWKLVGSARA